MLVLRSAYCDSSNMHRDAGITNSRDSDAPQGDAILKPRVLTLGTSRPNKTVPQRGTRGLISTSERSVFNRVSSYPFEQLNVNWSHFQRPSTHGVFE